MAVGDLIVQFATDFGRAVQHAPIARVRVHESGNRFLLFDREGEAYEPLKSPGFYAMFTREGVVYVGETDNLWRRQLKDPDGTAMKSKKKFFAGQGRPMLKHGLHHGWAARIGLDPLLIQLYSTENPAIARNYDADYSKSLEGVVALIIPQHHAAMVARAEAEELLPRR